jgi:hypothetical protein
MSVEENAEKIQELERQLEDLAKGLEEIEDPGERLVDQGFIAVGSDARQQIVHYIEIADTESFDTCEDIKNSKDAQKAFLEATLKREEDPDKRLTVNHGDFLILECQGVKIKNPGSDLPVEEPDGCYYMGTCSKVDKGIHELHCGFQEADPHGVCEEEKNNEGDVFRNFTAWHTCGGSNNFAFNIPELEADLFCKGKVEEDGTEEAVGIKLSFQNDIVQAYDGDEFDNKHAYVPLIKECPVTEKITLRDLVSTSDIGSYVTYGPCQENVEFQGEGKSVKISVRLPVIKTELTFKGGLLMEQSQEDADNSTEKYLIEFYAPCGGEASEEEEECIDLEICNDEGQIETVSVKICSSGDEE